MRFRVDPIRPWHGSMRFWQVHWRSASTDRRPLESPDDTVCIFRTCILVAYRALGFAFPLSCGFPTTLSRITAIFRTTRTWKMFPRRAEAVCVKNKTPLCTKPSIEAYVLKYVYRYVSMHTHRERCKVVLCSFHGSGQFPRPFIVHIRQVVP